MDCPSLKEIRGASLRGFPVTVICINVTLYQKSSTNDLEIAIDSNRTSVLNLYTSVSWWRYPSLKSLVARGGFYGAYISKAVICFFVC